VRPLDTATLRLEYSRAALDEASVDPNPIRQFERWFSDALASELAEPNAMCLSTVGAAGKPSARMVLLKGVSASGFVFFTNYLSRKGQELRANPNAALTFYWAELERQVRIEGTVAPVSPEESESYFASRPFRSRLGAAVSPQSQVIPSRAALEEEMARLEAQYAASEAVPRPDHWGGYRLSPDSIEFWQGRRSRLHDRILYSLSTSGLWEIRRLAP